MRQPVHIRAEAPDAGQTVPETDQHVYRAHALDKVEMLARLLQAEGRGLTMVFCRTKRTAQKVADELDERGFAAAAVHGDLGQGAREQALRAFRSGKVDVLVATDVAARGIDVPDVTHVVNFQCPEDEKTYLHRIGRTGRAGAAGVAVTFVDWDDLPRWELIDKALRLGLPQPPETYSTSSHLYADLGIPAPAAGTLPRSARTRAGLEAEVVEDLGETGGRRTRRAPARHGSRPDSGQRGEAADTEASPSRPRRTRTRRRTRAGEPVGGADLTLVEDAGTAVSPPPPAPASRPARALTPAEDAPVMPDPAADGSAASSASPRRRRRRGGRGRGAGSSVGAGGAAGVPSDAAVDSPATAPASE
jgi:superfamily II DNA/RNA helicase